MEGEVRVVIAFMSALLILGGCASHHPQTRGFDAAKITIEGSDFSVRWNGDVAEAIRTNYAPRRDHGRILLRAVVAIEQTTGCEVDQTTVKGDPALAVARIDC